MTLGALGDSQDLTLYECISLKIGADREHTWGTGQCRIAPLTFSEEAAGPRVQLPLISRRGRREKKAASGLARLPGQGAAKGCPSLRVFPGLPLTQRLGAWWSPSPFPPTPSFRLTLRYKCVSTDLLGPGSCPGEVVIQAAICSLASKEAELRSGGQSGWWVG